jgi:hypothetical protein
MRSDCTHLLLLWNPLFSTVGLHFMRYSVTTENLIMNDPGFVELSLERLGDNFDLEGFLSALKCNKTVKHVCFSGAFVRELTPEQWCLMIEGVGHLESLEQLQIWCSTIPVHTFGTMLQNAKHLKAILFFHVRLDGSEDDFLHFSGAIRHHLSLAEFRFGGIETIVENISLDCVIDALGDTPNLKIVTLQLFNSNRAAIFSRDALAHLLKSKSITGLYLTRLGLGQDHYVVIASAIATNRNLRVLDLFANNATSEQLLLIATGLRENHGLETFVLPGLSNLDFSYDCSIAIAETLKANTTIRSLYLPCSRFTDDGLILLAESLTVNTTLKKVEIGVSDHIGNQGMAALTQMLEKNYELERLIVDSAEKSIKSKIEYYMRLNAVGRGPLLCSGQANRVEWVNMLISVHDDLDCLFYFISMNPTICQFANASGADVIVTEEFKLTRRHSMMAVSSTQKMP